MLLADCALCRFAAILERAVNVNVNNLLAISKSDFDNSGEPGPQADEVNHLEIPLRQLQVTHRASSCAKRGGHVQLCSKPRRAHGIGTQDLPKKGSAFITSSDHWTEECVSYKMVVKHPDRQKAGFQRWGWGVPQVACAVFRCRSEAPSAAHCLCQDQAACTVGPDCSACMRTGPGSRHDSAAAVMGGSSGPGRSSTTVCRAGRARVSCTLCRAAAPPPVHVHAYHVQMRADGIAWFELDMGGVTCMHLRTRCVRHRLQHVRAAYDPPW